MSNNDIRYTETHEWAYKNDDNTVSVGISEFALEQLGDIVYLELPSIGDTVAKGAAFGVVESVKAASDIYSPVSGKVVEVNEGLVEDPDILKNDIYTDGWMIKIEMDDPEEFKELLDSQAYSEFVETQVED